jgi:hypothetical protein
MTPLVYQHIVPQLGIEHQVTPKRVLTKGHQPRPRTVCASCEKLVMMAPAVVGARL